jgi:integrase
MRWGVRPDGVNPCKHVEPFAESKRMRFLSAAEVAALGTALTEAERAGVTSAHVVAAIRLLMLTGCRKSEILTLRWDDVDIERALLQLRDSKTGQKVVYLNAPALQVLSELTPVDGHPFVIPGENEGEHANNIDHAWRKIRASAGLADVRLHDLRHSFASVAAGAGMSLPVIGALLGHRDAATTQRYAHLAADPLKQANDLIGARLMAAMSGGGGQVVEIPRKSRP